MGQKVSPVGLRVGINREWDASWYANKNEVADLLLEDLKIRKHLETVYAKAAVSRILIERVKGAKKDRVKITLYTAKPGVVIGRDALDFETFAENDEALYAIFNKEGNFLKCS